jgi:hypothetical protein
MRLWKNDRKASEKANTERAYREDKMIRELAHQHGHSIYRGCTVACFLEGPR